MTGSKPAKKTDDRETAIREKEAQAKAVLSDVVHEVESLEEGDADTKILQAVDGALKSAKGRAEEAKERADGAKKGAPAPGGR